MCLNCGCGQPNDLRGDPLNLSYNRLALIAARNHTTVKAVAENILGTILGRITPADPRGDQDVFTLKIIKKRIPPKPEKKKIEIFVPTKAQVRRWEEEREEYLKKIQKQAQEDDERRLAESQG